MIKYSEFHGRNDVFQHLTEKYITEKYEKLRNAGLSEDAAFDELYAEDCALDIEGETVFAEDVTGTLGEWLSMDTSQLPVEAVKALQKAYDICAKGFKSLIHRNKYMLITVYERELSTTMFETFTEAHNQMEKELKEDFTDEVEWAEFQYQYAEKGDAYRDDCELQEWSAWSNMHNSHTDWWIVEIPLGKE